MQRHTLIILVSVLVLIGSATWFVHKYFAVEAETLAKQVWPDPSAEQVEIRKLRGIAGWFSIDCGHVLHRQDADAAISCATKALRTREPFYVSFDYIGTDSTGVIGLAGDRSSRVFKVTTDELGRGAFGMISTSGPNRTVTFRLCDKGPVEETSYPANRYLSCPVTD